MRVMMMRMPSWCETYSSTAAVAADVAGRVRTASDGEFLLPLASKNRSGEVKSTCEDCQWCEGMPRL
jgi:hypothetical protein